MASPERSSTRNPLFAMARSRIHPNHHCPLAVFRLFNALNLFKHEVPLVVEAQIQMLRDAGLDAAFLKDGDEELRVLNKSPI
jgi:hypothetical protein